MTQLLGPESGAKSSLISKSVLFLFPPDYRAGGLGVKKDTGIFSQHFWKGQQGTHSPSPPAEDAISADYGGSALCRRLCAHTQPHIR